MKSKWQLLLISIFAVSLLMVGCGGSEEAPEEERYEEVRGIYLGHGPDAEYITIVHEDIPDVMEAMRMRVLIEDPAKIDDLDQGDKISFTLVRSGMSWYARDIIRLPDNTELDIPEDLVQ